jgi:hypothetical protein
MSLRFEIDVLINTLFTLYFQYFLNAYLKFFSKSIHQILVYKAMEVDGTAASDPGAYE